MPRLNRMPGFNAAVRAALMPKFTYRMRFLAFTITQGANTVLPLLQCVADSDPDYDQLIDGTSPAECAAGTKIIACQLHFQIVAGQDNEIIEWVLLRDPDGALAAAATQSIDTLYTQDKSLNSMIMRKNAVAAGHIIMDSNHGTPEVRVNIPRKALRRISTLQENDFFKIVFTMTAAGGNATLYGRGRIITRIA